MVPMIRGELAALLIVAMVLSSCAQQPSVKVLARTETDTGLIDGTVIYEDGKPVKGATAYAHPTDRGMVAKIPQAETDETGYFAIRHLWLGKFAVTAKKEDASQKRNRLSIFACSPTGIPPKRDVECLSA